MCTTERACAGIVKLELVFFWWLSFKHGRVGISRYLSYENAIVVHQKQLPCPSLPLSDNARQPRASSLLQLLLGAELVGVTALLLAAVGGTGRETSLVSSQISGFLGRMRIGCVAKTYVALAADGLVAVVLGGKGLQGRLNDTTTEAEDQVEGRLLWWVLVIRSFAYVIHPFSKIRPRGFNEPSGCCNRKGCGHPRAACRRRSSAVGLGECPPCPGSCSSHCRWCQRTRPRG
jgi:hypothetical protein